MKQLIITFFIVACFATSTSAQVAGDSIAVDSTSVNMLREVIVTTPQINVRCQGMDYTINNIRGSQLADAGSMMDMLFWTPGIAKSRKSSTKSLAKQEHCSKSHANEGRVNLA